MSEEHPEPNATTLGSLELAGATVIGRYHLLQRIGEGGMGEVWLAEQKEPVRRRVALKLVKAGMNTREVIARFESERQALALMDHPAIAKVLDAGSTSQGAPYFVMEYVAGVPITTYCDNHCLSTRDRLELFMRVCDGVQHAHQKAIIHRDLKPSNILVTEVDGKAMPKIIDFGVAKALTQRLTANTMFTQVGDMIGTPEYMSPEQAYSSGEDIDTRTDVYSLGIIFYELLAGMPPLELRKVAFEEFLRRLREEDPPKPSTKLRTQDPATSTELARRRQTEPPALAKQMRGELDSIALKALEKDRSRRYGSPSDFAADIGRYLRNEPVLAVPPSLAYRARKFARRYRVALATACAFALVLIVAAVVSIRQGIRANREAAVAQAVNDFLQSDLLAQASAYNQSKPDPNITVRTVLDRAAQRVNGRFDHEPEVEAAIRETIGQTYQELGQYAESRKQLERALGLYRQILGPRNAKTLKTINDLAHTARDQGKYSEAESLYDQSLPICRQVLGPEHPETLRAMTGLAATDSDQRKYTEAEGLYSQALEIGRRALGPDHSETLKAMNGLAGTYFAEGKYAQAESLFSQALETRRRVSGPEHPATLLALNNLGNTYEAEGKNAAAEDLYREALEVRRRVLGPEHPDTLYSATSLASVEISQAKYASAEVLFRQVVEAQRRVLGPEHPDTLYATHGLAVAYDDEGKYAEAGVLFSQTLEAMRRVLGPEHPFTLTAMANLGEVYEHEEKYAESEALFKQNIEIRERVLGPENSSTLATVSDLALLYLRQGKYALAETYAARALAGRRHASGSQNPDTMAAESDLALVYIGQGKFADSEALAHEALETEKKVQADDWQRFRAESLLGASLAGEYKYSEAEPLLLEGYKGMQARKDRVAVPDWYHLDRAHEWLVRLYQAWGKPSKAAEWRKK